VANEWNIWDEEIISGCSLAGFKRKLDRHLRDTRTHQLDEIANVNFYAQHDGRPRNTDGALCWKWRAKLL